MKVVVRYSNYFRKVLTSFLKTFARCEKIQKKFRRLQAKNSENFQKISKKNLKKRKKEEKLCSIFKS